MTLLLTLEALDLESALMKLRCQNSFSLAPGGLERGRAAQGWMGPGGWTAGWTACAVGNYGFCAHAGMLVLTHGTRLHPTRVPACLSGTRTVTDHSLLGVRHRRQRGAAAAVLVLVHVRDYACHCCDSCLWTQCTHPNACGTFYGLYTRLQGLVSVYPSYVSPRPCTGY